MNSMDDPLRKAMNAGRQQMRAPQGGTGNQPPPKDNEVFEMLWDCRFCDTKKLLGLEHRHCPNCGAPQNPEWRYFPTEADMKFVTDKNYQYAGADVTCPYCQQPNSKAAKFCVSCGGDLSNAANVIVRGNIDARAATSTADDVVKKKFERDLGITEEKQKQSFLGGVNPAIPIIVVVGLLIACIAGFLYLSNSTVDSRFAVTDVTWQTGVTMQQLVTRSGSDWQNEMPGGAYNVSCRPQQRQYVENVQVQCGYDLVDQGDGTGRRVPKYCTEQQSRYVTEQMCSYSYDVWVPLQDITASGGLADPIATPAYGGSVGIGRIRRVGDFLILTVRFRDTQNSQGYDYNPNSEAEWRTFRPGQNYTVKINRLGQVQWDTLQQVAQ